MRLYVLYSLGKILTLTLTFFMLYPASSVYVMGTVLSSIPGKVSLYDLVAI